ncbi:MAG: polysaccharide biosynthesis protein [Candidatus Marithrix sp.]|nr:polysaccharide biosynthesis protein [Candidatus Marithrix sp.]
MVAIAWTLAIILRYDLPLEPEVATVFWQVLPIAIGVQSLVLWYGGLYKGVWRFASLPDLVTILRTSIIGTFIVVLVLVLFNRLEFIPRSSLIFYPFLLIATLGMPRLLYRLWHEHSLKFILTDNSQPQQVLILGSGSSGDMLVRDMLRNRGSGYMPVGFLDDRKRLHGGKVQGVPVLGSIDKLSEIIESLKVDIIIIAIPSATEEQMRHIIELCEQCSVPVRTLPKLDRVINQQVNLNDLHPVAIDDLLGRAKIQLDWQIILAGLQSKVVMVSGGGGSIGSELCQQIAKLIPTSLIIVERGEFNLYNVEMQVRQEFPDLTLHACLGDITDVIAMRHILQLYQPDIVFHAAAYKHVPMLQSQAREAVRNNILGTHILAKTVVEQGCKAFVMISTDKAVNPTNIMGATKRAAEIICQAMNNKAKTNFITVRFGNVLGSAGSVVPLFNKQIAAGGPVTVTHTEISRYFMTIPEACQLILQAGSMGKGGEIFVLDMGKPIKIKYLAEQMIRLSGKNQGQDIKIVYTGLRPGEKLHEELFHVDEKLGKTTHAKILLAAHRSNNLQQLTTILEQLTNACNNYAEDEIVDIVQHMVPEWQKNSSN